MLLLGLLLMAATGAFTGLLIADNSAGGPDYTVTMLGNNLGTMNSLEVFIAGIVLALIFGFGLLMLFGATAMHRRRRAMLLAERRDAEEARAQRDAMAARMDTDQTVPNEFDEPAATSPRSGMPATEMPADETGTGTTTGRRRHRHVFGH